MKWQWFLAIFFIAVIQTTFLKYFEIGGVVPNILLVLALFFIIFFNFGKIWPYLFLIGLLLDFFSSFPPGTNLTALMATAAVISFLTGGLLNRKSIFACVFLGFSGLLIFYSFFTGFIALFAALSDSLTSDFMRSAFHAFSIGAIYNFCIFILALIFGKKIKTLNDAE